MKQQKDKKALKRYLLMNTDGDGIKCIKYMFYLSVLGLPALMESVSIPIVELLMALPYLIVFGIVFYKRHKTTAFLARAGEEGELDRLVEDFLNAQPILADRLRVGSEWLFGQGSRYPVRIENITELRHEPPESILQGKLFVTMDPNDGESLLCRYPATTPFKEDVGGLAYYLLKIIPNIIVDSSLSDLSTEKASTQLANKMASNAVHGKWGTCAWEIDDQGVLRVGKGTGAPCNGKNPWAKRALQITSAHFEPGVVLPADCDNLFAGCVSLVKLDDGSWDMSHVKTMKRMFCGCSSLRELTSAIAWNTSQVEDMTCAFDGCSSLGKVFTANWDTSSVRNMTGLFWDCSSLRYLGLSLWDTSQVDNMCNLFAGCTSLVGAPVSHWDVSRVVKASCMFKDCKSLAGLDLSLWNTGRLSDARAMFDGCDSLDSLALPSQLAERLNENRVPPDAKGGADNTSA